MCDYLILLCHRPPQDAEAPLALARLLVPKKTLRRLVLFGAFLGLRVQYSLEYDSESHQKLVGATDLVR